MSDDFSTNQPGLSSPCANAAAVTPSDDTDLTKTTRAVYVGGVGDLEVNMAGTGDAVVFPAVPAGTILPIRVTRILDANTTATNIIALW